MSQNEPSAATEALATSLAEVLAGAPATAIAFVTCATHGTLFPAVVRVAGNDLPNDCPTCIAERAEEERRAYHAKLLRDRDAERAAKGQREVEARLGRALIPARFAEYTLTAFPIPRDPALADRVRTVLAACRSYVNAWPRHRRRGTGLVLLGPQGTGKTGLACGIANALLRDFSASALFMTAYGCVRFQRDAWNRKAGGRTEGQALETLLKPDLLIVDEVGVQVGSDLEMLLLFEVLNGRYAERRPTIVISNLPMSDFEIGGQSRPGLRTFFGARLIDRLLDDETPVLACQWPSLRGMTA